MVLTGLPHMDRYHHCVEHAILYEIATIVETLAGAQIMHINTTAKGGGVVEILQSLSSFFQGSGIEHSWQIVEIDQSAAPFMTKLIDTLQGGEPGDFTREEQDQFHQALEVAAQHLREHRADVYFVHDLQLAPLTRLLPELHPAVWFCHMDIANPNSNARAYIEAFFEAYRLCAFNSAASIPRNLPPERSQVITLGIDPFKPKNADLPRAAGLDLIAQCGIDVRRPLMTQVSRYDRWKNPWQAVDMYRLVKKRIPSVQLAFVGAMEASDDSTADEVFADLQAYAGADPDVHLLYDPQAIGEMQVNAFQRYSTVVIQRSTREGFGLTVTEAMWKEQPVVGTSATGLRNQIVDGHTGYIVDETEQAAERVVELIERPDLRRALGRQAREHVSKHFLVPQMALTYLRAVARAVHQRNYAVGQ